MTHKSRLVDALPAMLHVRALAAQGMPMQLMADRSGLSDRTIRAYFNGWGWSGHRRTGNVKRPVTHAEPDTVARILALRFEEVWNPSEFQPDRMRGLRESVGVSRIALGKAAGINPCTIQYWETGRSLPKYRPKLDAVLNLLGASWEDVSSPLGEVEEVPADECSMIFSEGTVDVEQDYVPDYPCLVCGGIFRSRLLLRTHPHPAKVKVSA